ncbi:MAG TPA: phenylalanine--tRNA ligase subunit beta [Candidatus Coproplasma stercoripullorum]|uniref:Phenylalanine--tRNA ligase beta subunit n=1 Tax=Candidatus Coproplasma stercoripullorum TaxID=2840751 RepID=A0A9D1DC62_9FIRM|nr:phenylalanine--tRNA ligase subunit beta [Candidatus Coproplasma stercoripullorum]
MKAPLSWLKDYVDIDVTAEELEEKLFSCGFEVEELTDVGKDISGVYVGEVTECEPVEGTHLHVCKVDCGDKGVFQICCGADNVKIGIKAPVALEGATVYATAKDHVTVEGVMTIKKGKLRGIDSFGMLCSGVELGVNGDMFEGADYNGLLILPSSCRNGEDVKPILGLNDYIFDISVTANRPDCQSVLGIAREVAAVLKKPLKEPRIDYNTVHDDRKVKVTITAPELCPRYIAHYVKDIKIGPSPMWLKRRLALCGLRSISNVVDITNFVLLEMGQPMHAFDLDTIEGSEIVVRRAHDGEKIVTLDEKEFTLNRENLVICDGSKPAALAGIMGGLNTEIKDSTREVLFEAAKFARDSVRKTSRSLGQHSDSSAIFEKGTNEYTTERAMKRALHLIDELGCGTVTDVCADVATEYSDTSVKHMAVSAQKINALLGIEVPAETMKEILENLNFGVSMSGDCLELTLPPYRDDLFGYPDIAEEIIRMYGYEHIHGTFMPTAKVTNGGWNEEQRTLNKLRDMLVSEGLYEISNYSFYSEKDLDMLRIPEGATERKYIRILNPISEELAVMRTFLAPSMVNTMLRNLKRGNYEGGEFEFAKVYIPESVPINNFPEERMKLCIGLWGSANFFDMKGITENIADSLNVKFEYVSGQSPYLHPGINADILCDGDKVGYIGAVDPAILESIAAERPMVIAELDYELLKKHAKPFKYIPLPKYPEAQRDLALISDREITCGQIEREIYSACKYVTDVKLFDVYIGNQIESGKKSMAFTVTFTPKDEALSGEKVDGFIKKILSNLKFKLGITLR